MRDGDPKKSTPRRSPRRWCVYLARCADGSLYCGATNDLQKRLAAHNAGRGARYTRARRPVVLAWSRTCGTRAQALKAEYAIKQLARAQKDRLVRKRRRAHGK